MSLKDSKSIRLLREKGLNKLVLYCLTKYSNKIKKKSVFIFLNFYPKLALTKSQYKTFKLAYKHFSENYKNIIAISPLFFIKNLKKHIAWIEQDEFQRKYGNMLPIELIQQLSVKNNFNNSSMIAPPPPC